jgi:hypothetical protein
MIQPISQLKKWFKKYAYPTQEQFWDWLDSYWHKDETIPVNKIDGLIEVVENVTAGLDEKFATKQNKLLAGNGIILTENGDSTTTIATKYEESEEESQRLLPIHAQGNSMNVTEKLSIVGVALNRNCKAICFLDKTNANNMFVIEIQEGEYPIDPIPLLQFYDKPIYVIAAENENGKGVDISLILNIIE